MKAKPPSSTDLALRRRAEAELRALGADGEHRPMMAKVAREVTTHIRKEQTKSPAQSEADTQRLLHELQVHQIELEMQNTELQEARNRMEALLDKYTDLYDFAPVGYFSLDESGLILEANLTGAALLGVERSRLLRRRLQLFVAPPSGSTFNAFLEKVFSQPAKQICEASLLKEDGAVFWADLQAVSAISPGDPQKWCRVAISDITALKRAKEERLRMDALTLSNRNMKREIIRRQVVETALKTSEKQQRGLLADSRVMQEQLRQLARQVLHAQEEERKKISRELHDVIAQTLTGINIRLAVLKKEAAHNINGLDRNITITQRLVEKSVNIVHQFARELRPAVLDDLGLVPALHSYMKHFTARTGVQGHLKCFTTGWIKELDTSLRTVLYRVAQEAITNVGRHAKANRVEVVIQKLPDGISMKISDDGKSFGVEETLRANRGKRLGLLGMRERLEMVGGKFGIKSEPGQGTTIAAQIPFRKTGGGGALTESAETKV